MCSTNVEQMTNKLCNMYSVQFPVNREEFTTTEILPYLTPTLATYLQTTDYSLVYDYRPFFLASAQLKLDRYVGVNKDGPGICVGENIKRWRSDETIRKFIEVFFLCKIPLTILSSDLRGIFGFDVSEEELVCFRDLFADIEYANGECWLNYVKSIGMEEAEFRRKLMREPQDFVRWKMGVPVTLDSDRVLDRLISDAYYTERLIKHKTGDNGVTLGKCELDRVKMERETIFKGLDRRVKLKTLALEAGTKTNTDASDEIRRIVLEYETHNFSTKAEVIMSEEPTVDDLKKQNANNSNAGSK
jgi:hypothetical protein